MGAKMAVSFANIFMAEVETDIINQSPNIPLNWKRYIDDTFPQWNINKEAINNFTELANSFHPAIKFTTEISDTEITFLDTYIQSCVYKGDRFKKHTIWSQFQLKNVGSTKQTKKAQKDFAVCYRIPPINAWSQTYSCEQMASYTKLALTTKNIQKPSPYFI